MAFSTKKERRKRNVGLLLGFLIVCWFALCLAAAGGGLYVIGHFVSKFW